MPPVPQVVVRTIPESGRKSLYLASHAGRIFGMSEHEGPALIDQLIAHATAAVVPILIAARSAGLARQYLHRKGV